MRLMAATATQATRAVSAATKPNVSFTAQAAQHGKSSGAPDVITRAPGPMLGTALPSSLPDLKTSEANEAVGIRALGRFMAHRDSLDVKS